MSDEKGPSTQGPSQPTENKCRDPNNGTTEMNLSANTGPRPISADRQQLVRTVK